MDFNENSTAPEAAHSGEQAGAVASPAEWEETSETTPEPSRENADFALVDVGEDDAEPETGDASSGEAEADAEADAGPDGAGREHGEQRAAQTREENAAIRAARLRAQREAERDAAARTDAEIAGLGGLRDPYTGAPFRSMEELRAYSDRVLRAETERRAQREGRSVQELTEEDANRAFVSRLREEDERRRFETARLRDAERAQLAFLERDVLDFREKHPEADVAALEQNPQFRQFCGSRFGREPLAGLYEDFLTLLGSAEATAAKRSESRGARATGGGSASGGAVLTPAQKKELDAWNAANPEMAMTAKEFLRR